MSFSYDYKFSFVIRDVTCISRGTSEPPRTLLQGHCVGKTMPRDQLNTAVGILDVLPAGRSRLLLVSASFFLGFKYDLHDDGSAQTVISRFRDYGPSGVPHPAMAHICGTDLVVRRQEGKLDVRSTHTHPGEARYAWYLAEVSLSYIHRFPLWKI